MAAANLADQLAMAAANEPPAALTGETTTGEEAADGGSAEAAKGSGKSDFYASKEYWDDRFKDQKGTFDWYATWEEMGPLLADHGLAPSAQTKTLMVGCGNSTLSEEMFDAGFSDLTNIDISGVVIGKMQERCKDKGEGLRWLEMDATNTSFDAGSFDLAVDKGTVDALMCDSDTKGPAVEVMREAGRILRVSGQFVVVSHHAQRIRVMDAAMSSHTEPWTLQLREKRRCDLSQSATMINILRAQLNGEKTISEAMQDPVALLKAMKEFKNVMRDRVLARKIEEFKARKAKKAKEEAEEAAKLGSAQAEAAFEALEGCAAAPEVGGGYPSAAQQPAAVARPYEVGKENLPVAAKNTEAPEPQKGAKETTAVAGSAGGQDEEGSTEQAEAKGGENEEDEQEGRQGLRQQFCWVYIFDKVAR